MILMSSRINMWLLEISQKIYDGDYIRKISIYQISERMAYNRLHICKYVSLKSRKIPDLVLGDEGY